MEKEKIVPRKRLENETENDYKLYLRNFYYNLNPPKPSYRYDFAYENKLVDSAEVMDGENGKYIKYLEGYYRDYYSTLENQVNLFFYMHTDNSVEQKNKTHSIKNYFTKKNKEKKQEKGKLALAKDYIVNKISTKKDKAKKESKINQIKNYFIEKHNIRKQNKEDNKKLTLFEKVRKILQGIAIGTTALTLIISTVCLFKGATIIGIVGMISGVLGITLTSLVNYINKDEEITNDDSLEENIDDDAYIEEENKKSKNKGKILSLFSRKQNTKNNDDVDYDTFEFDLTEVKEESNIDLTESKEESNIKLTEGNSENNDRVDFEFDLTGSKEESNINLTEDKSENNDCVDFEFDLNGITPLEEENYTALGDAEYGVFENHYRLDKNHLIDNKLEFTSNIQANTINIEEFTEPKKIEQKDIKRLEKHM